MEIGLKQINLQLMNKPQAEQAQAVEHDREEEKNEEQNFQEINAHDENYPDQLKESNVHSVVSQKSSPQDLLKVFQEFTPSSNLISMADLHASPKLKLKKYKEAVYYGDFEGGKRHGIGILLYENGRVYEGNWKCDFKFGEGFEKFINGCLYKGDYVNGRPEGIGKYSWPNGQFYEGEWVGGIKQGSGMWRGAKGDSYIGEWKNGKADGYGVHTWMNGDRYEGEFKQCLKSGEGIEKFANGDLYRGSYQRGKPFGFGEYYWQNGSYFKGNFKDGLRDGHGIWKRGPGNSDKYEGSYKEDKKHGYGIFTWASGNVYKGNYDMDLRSGAGEMYWRDGSFYKGQWQGGVQHGEGEVYVPSEGYKKGLFEDNVLVIVDKESKAVPGEKYPADPEKYLDRSESKRKPNVNNKLNFRSRGVSMKKNERANRSIDENNVIRYSRAKEIKNHPLLPKRFDHSREAKYSTMERKTIKSQKNPPIQNRILHSSFYMHRLHNNRASTSVNGSRADSSSAYSMTRDRNRREMMVVTRTVEQKGVVQREQYSDFA